MTDDSSAYKHVMENAANTSVFHGLYQTTVGHPDAFFVGNYSAILGALENNPKLLFFGELSRGLNLRRFKRLKLDK